MENLIQKTLTRVRTSLVRITYEVESGGSLQKQELPFVVGILADLSGDRAPETAIPAYAQRRILPIDRDSFDAVMKAASPRIQLDTVARIPSAPGQILCAGEGQSNLCGDIYFSSIDDFDPLALIHRVPDLQRLYAVRSSLRDLQSHAEANDSLHEKLNALMAPTAEGHALRQKLSHLANPEIGSTDPEAQSHLQTPTQPSGAGDAVSEFLQAAQLQGSQSDIDPQRFLASLGFFVSEVLSRPELSAAAPAQMTAISAIDQHVSDIDAWLSLQVSEILHAPSFQGLEATWRGLHYLVTHTETNALLKLGVFNATQEELLDDMASAVDTEQSTLFKLLHEDMFFSFAGAPYGLLVGDYAFGGSAKDIEFLTHMSKVAAAGPTPFIAAASADLFGLKSFHEMNGIRDLSKMFESADLAGWQAFRETEDSRFVSLVLPRALMRLPYGTNTLPVEGIAFEENVTPSAGQPDPHCFLWGNAAYLLAERITNAFALYRWTAAIEGVDGGGLVEGLPTYSLSSESAPLPFSSPAEVFISSQRAQKLHDLGFVVLSQEKAQSPLVFPTSRLKKHATSIAAASDTALASASVSLPYLLTASRFANYIKTIMRAKIGSFMTRANVEAYLNTWIAQYVLLDSDVSVEVQAAYPLRQANVVVTERDHLPGAYRATVFVCPHFQLQGVAASIRLVVDLPR